jgi:glycosyltransferase involved in cell wall biosynthesis
VILEAMACGTPVAAYPVDGPLEVMCDAQGTAEGGILDADLLSATNQALTMPRNHARQRALQFSWENSAKIFAKNLVDARLGKLAIQV